MASRFSLIDPWVWRMAWRDSRSHRRRLALFLSCILLGVSSLVAIRSLGDDLKRAVSAQSKVLLGADLAIWSRQAFEVETEALIDSLGGDRSREVRFASMVYFPKTAGTRLVQVRAMAGDFPYYGALVTEPPEAARQYREGGGALLDDGLMLQFGAGVGDSVRVGAESFRIAGRVKKIPGEALAVMTLAPRVFIPMRNLEQTGLIRQGSLATYRVYFKFEEGVQLRPIVRAVREHRDRIRIQYETVQSRQRRMGRTLDNLYRFLSLVGFAALLLGCVGVASAMQVYVRQKLGTVAVLRCLGAQARQAFTIYLIQAAAMGLIGSGAGAVLGLLVQRVLPGVLGQFLPVDLSVTVSWAAVVQGVATGLGMALLFALLPLMPVRRVSPLRTLRASYEEKAGQMDLLRVGIVLLIVLVVVGLAVVQTGRWRVGIGVTVGFGAAFGLLAGVAFLLMKGVKRFFPTSWRYVWRQGLANLYRPHNQTAVLMLSLGLGTFLISTLYVSQHSLLEQVALAGSGDRPNLVFFDIQTDQADGVAKLVGSFGLPVLHRVPVVTMRLASLKERRVEAILTDPDRSISRWALSREYRSTYRNHLFDSERLLSGSWTGSVAEGAVAAISLEEGIARTLGVTLGDRLTFDVQGVPIATTVGSIREVDWQRVQPNFFVVFPGGVLEPAPQFHVLTTRVASSEGSAALQRQLVQTFPNVSAVDLELVLQTADEVLSQVAFVIRFMALFSILTGLVVLASAVLTSRYQRIQEGVLLRTLGASRRQIVQILFLEYLFLGGLAALTGLILSLGGAWGLARFVFEVAFAVPVPAIAGAFALVTGLTVGVGMLNSRGIAERPPLEVLRAEG